MASQSKRFAAANDDDDGDAAAAPAADAVAPAAPPAAAPHQCNHEFTAVISVVQDYQNGGRRVTMHMFLDRRQAELNARERHDEWCAVGNTSLPYCATCTYCKKPDCDSCKKALAQATAKSERKSAAASAAAASAASAAPEADGKGKSNTNNDDDDDDDDGDGLDVEAEEALRNCPRRKVCDECLSSPNVCVKESECEYEIFFEQGSLTTSHGNPFFSTRVNT